MRHHQERYQELRQGLLVDGYLGIEIPSPLLGSRNPRRGRDTGDPAELRKDETRDTIGIVNVGGEARSLGLKESEYQSRHSVRPQKRLFQELAPVAEPESRYGRCNKMDYVPELEIQHSGG